MSTPLEQFFAVTASGSVYQIENRRDPTTRFPFVKKIVGKGGSLVEVGGMLQGGHLVAITSHMIGLYIEQHPKPGARQQPHDVNTNFWGGHTTAVVALFLDQTKALLCTRQETLEMCDLRFAAETLEVLDTIGDAHPLFIVQRNGEGSIREQLSKKMAQRGTKLPEPQPQPMIPEAPGCDVCGHITTPQGGGYKCLNCGNTMSCS